MNVNLNICLKFLRSLSILLLRIPTREHSLELLILNDCVVSSNSIPVVHVRNSMKKLLRRASSDSNLFESATM